MMIIDDGRRYGNSRVVVPFYIYVFDDDDDDDDDGETLESRESAA